MSQNTQTFVLVGDFKDNITPSLKRLSTQIESLNKKFGKLQTMVRPIARDMAILADATTRMGGALKSQRGSFDQNIRAMQQYRREMGKMSAAQRQLQRQMRTPPPPRGGTVRRSGGWGGAPPTRGGRRGGGGDGGSFVGDVISGGLITNAIVSGFQLGANIIETSMNKVFTMFGERIDDQIADIAGAGGIFSGAKAAGLTAFGKTMDDAMDVQKELNRSMATLAADLPGTTNDFVRNARSITDTMMTAMSKNPKDFVKSMEGLSGRKGLDEKGALITAATSVAQSTTMLEKLSPGGGMPMTMLFEDLMARDTVDAKAMQKKYASMRRNPTLIAALERNQKEINKYAAGSAQRLVAISKALNEAVPPEMVNMMKRSVSGIVEAFKSNFMDPDTGIFGLSRQMGFMVKQFDTTTGKVRLDKAGKEISEAVGIFEMLADIIGNLGVVINSSVVPALMNVIFPFDEMGKSLVKLREFSFKVFEQFQQATKWFANIGAKYGMDASTFQASTRGGMATLANIFRSFGEINMGQYKDIITQLESKDPGAIKKVGSQLLEIFKGSKFLDTITEAAGTIVGGFLDAIADIMDMLIEGSEKFAAKGFGKGFQKAGGFRALTRIFSNAFKLIGKAIFEGIKLWLGSMGESLRRLDFSALLGQLGITAAFIWPFLGGPIKFLMGAIFKALGARIAATSAAGWVAGNLPVLTQGLSKLGSFILPPLMSALRGALTNAARIALSGAGLTAAAIAAVAGLIYIFQDPLKNAIDQIQMWFSKNVGGAIGEFVKGLTLNWKGWINVIAGIFDGLIGLVTFDGERLKRASAQMIDGFNQIIVGIGKMFESIGPAIQQGVNMLGRAITSLFQKLWNAIVNINPNAKAQENKNNSLNPQQLAKYNAAVRKWTASGGVGAKPQPGQFISSAKGSPGQKFGTLQSAISNEMANKPPGSKLVIANSSETIIPAASAAGGFGGGMKGVIDAIWRSGAQVAATTMKGFDELRNTITAGDAKNAQATARAGALTKSAIDRSIAVSMAGDAKIMSAIKAASAAGGFGAGMGGALGGASGNLQAAAGLAKSMGLTMTSYKRSGPPNASYHNVGRAMDFSNSTGPTPQMMQFAQGMAAKYGSSMAELIYTPLGYSIKNGKKIPPIAQASHYNHVHVAFARGIKNPTVFSSATEAIAYEKMMMPSSARVQSVTSNTSEGLMNGHTTVNQNITISGAQDPQRLAEIVFDYASRAAQRVNNASFA